MRLTRVVPPLASLPELRSFRCDACGAVRTVPFWKGVERDHGLVE